MNTRTHEKRIIDRFLRDQFSDHSHLSWPDLVPGSSREIDATFTNGQSRVALEHTRIARFPEEAASREQFKKIQGALGDLSHSRPAGRLSIFLPCRDLGGKAARRSIVKTLSREIPALAKLHPGGRGIDVPINESINAWAYLDKRQPSTIVLKQFQPESKEQFLGVGQQIRSKVAKLLTYKRRGYRTLLLIESMHPDSYPHSITDALIAAERLEDGTLDELWEVSPYGPTDVRYCVYDLESFRKHHRAAQV